ncbi:MAG: lysylphosphatidylglycerol synthase domain-containing protein [Nanoarchaeota archaeon]|nr:lysylphosphatidylglycerol synthase domain-containing protein [Nanoarchaeota archaeon]
MHWKDIAKKFIVVAIFGYLLYRLYVSWGELASYNFDLNYWLLAISIIIFLIFYFLEGLGYDILLKIMHCRIPFKAVLKARYVSDMGRYIPGKIWTVLGRLYFLRRFKITKLQVIISSLLEMALMVSGGILIFFLSLFFWDYDFGNWIYFIFLFIPLALIFLHPKFLNLGIKIIGKISKKKQPRIESKYCDLLSALAFYLFYWVVYGLGAFFIINAVYDLSYTKIPFIIGVFAISWFLGFVSFIAPGGLGVRDGLIVYFLMFIIPEPIAIIIALLLRIILTLIEGLYAFVSLKLF